MSWLWRQCRGASAVQVRDFGAGGCDTNHVSGVCEASEPECVGEVCRRFRAFYNSLSIDLYCLLSLDTMSAD